MSELNDRNDEVIDEIEYWSRRAQDVTQHRLPDAKSILMHDSQLKRQHDLGVAIRAMSIAILLFGAIPLLILIRAPEISDRTSHQTELATNSETVTPSTKIYFDHSERGIDLASNLDDLEAVLEIEKMQLETQKLQRRAIRQRLIAGLDLTDTDNIFKQEELK